MTGTAVRMSPARLAAERLEKTVAADAVRHNVAVLRSAAASRRIMAVVKGDAYGLGAPAVRGLLVASGVEALAVDTVAEGVGLRDHGIDVPIRVMDVDVADAVAPGRRAAIGFSRGLAGAAPGFTGLLNGRRCPHGRQARHGLHPVRRDRRNERAPR